MYTKVSNWLEIGNTLITPNILITPKATCLRVADGKPQLPAVE